MKLSKVSTALLLLKWFKTQSFKFLVLITFIYETSEYGYNIFTPIKKMMTDWWLLFIKQLIKLPDISEKASLDIEMITFVYDK